MKAFLFVCAIQLSTIANAQTPVSPSPTPFDGAWTVRIDCPATKEESGAKGYTYDFPATVTNGFISGSHGLPTSAGSLRIEGPIAPNGDALLQARGRTGNPDYAVKNPSSGTPYSFRIKAHFEPASGTGSRMESRVCNFTFKK